MREHMRICIDARRGGLHSLATAHWWTATIGRYFVLSANQWPQSNGKLFSTSGGMKCGKLISRVLHATEFEKSLNFVFPFWILFSHRIIFKLTGVIAPISLVTEGEDACGLEVENDEIILCLWDIVSHLTDERREEEIFCFLSLDNTFRYDYFCQILVVANDYFTHARSQRSVPSISFAIAVWIAISLFCFSLLKSTTSFAFLSRLLHHLLNEKQM